jgi:hypothetical protein
MSVCSGRDIFRYIKYSQPSPTEQEEPTAELIKVHKYSSPCRFRHASHGQRLTQASTVFAPLE